MLKLWIKHKLSEIALNNAFSSLIQNFTPTPTPTPPTYKKGDKFHLIRLVKETPSKEIRYTALINATILKNTQGFLHIAYEHVAYDYFITPSGNRYDGFKLRGRVVRLVHEQDIVYAGKMI